MKRYILASTLILLAPAAFACETVTVGGEVHQVVVRSTAKHALAAGRWDPIAELLEADDAITATAARLPYL